MPPRHISPQSFDDILSELGDDPAIPDPHGIRKTSTLPRAETPPQNKHPKTTFFPKSLEFNNLTFSRLWILGGILLLCGGGLFFYFEHTKFVAEEETSSLQNQLLALKEDFEFSQSEWHSERDDLYEAIDEIEVSVHSINTKPPIQTAQSNLAAIPYEADLRRWRYLGIASMGAAEQAFFHTGKSTRMVAKQDLVLGDWRLTQVDKELAVLNHPRGKSITFKSNQPE